jgi:hypothetical protein
MVEWLQGLIMQLPRAQHLNLLFNLLLSVLLLGSMDLSFSHQIEGGAPFFNDSGSSILSPESTEELQESMPELHLFPPQNPSQALPPLGEPLGSP